MSDSQFTTAPLLNPASQFDASQIDKNFRAISAFDQTSTLPALPDSVRLDLASLPGADENSLSSFLNGIHSDLQDTPEPAKPVLESQRNTGLQQAQIILAGISNQRPPTRLSQTAVSTWKQKAIAGGYIPDTTPVDEAWSPEFNRIRGEMAFDQYNNALRGNRVGAIPLGSDDGEGHANGVMKLLGDFTSPSGLLAAATDLDLLPNIGNVVSEFKGWGQKWSQVAHSKNPWDFAGNLIDAITGPLDDLFFPILNDALLFTGVGEIFNSARLGWMGVRLGEAAVGVDDIYNTAKLASTAANLTEIGRASWTAEKLMGSGNELFQSIGRGMEAWRGFTPVRATKTFVQQGMRLGAASVLENQYLGGYKGGGFSASDVPGVGGVRDTLKAGPGALFAPIGAQFGVPGMIAAGVLSAVPEVLLAPYNIFSPGTFVRSTEGGFGLLSRAGHLAFKGLGSTGGRATVGALAGVAAGTVAGDDRGDILKGAAAGAAVGAALPLIGKAISNPTVAGAARGAVLGGVTGLWLGEDPKDAALGALAGAGLFAMTDTARYAFAQSLGVSKWNRVVQGAGHAFELSDFAPLASDQNISVGFHNATRRWLQNDADKLARFDATMNDRGLFAAVGELHEIPEEQAAGLIGFMYVSFAADHIAHAQSYLARAGDRLGAYHMARNKIIGQLRNFGDLQAPTEGQIDDIITAMARAEHGSGRNVTKRVDELRKLWADNPDGLLELANGHNIRATETLEQLVNPKNFPDADAFAVGGLTDPQRVSQMLGPDWGGTIEDGRRALFEQYLPQTMDSFGRWPNYIVDTQAIRDAHLGGLFEGATFKPYEDRTGRLRSVFAAKRGALPDDVAAAAAGVNNRLPTVDPGKLGVLKYGGLVSAIEGGRMTPALAGTATKQDLFKLADQVRDVLKAHKEFNSLAGGLGTKSVRWERTLLELGTDVPVDEMMSGQIDQVVKALDAEYGRSRSSEYLLDYARRHKLSLDQMEATLADQADSMARDAELWSTHGLKSFASADDNPFRELSGVEALQARLKEIQYKAKYTAAEVDLDDLIARAEAVPTAATAAARTPHDVLLEVATNELNALLPQAREMAQEVHGSFPDELQGSLDRLNGSPREAIEEMYRLQESKVSLANATADMEWELNPPPPPPGGDKPVIEMTAQDVEDYARANQEHMAKYPEYQDPPTIEDVRFGGQDDIDTALELLEADPSSIDRFKGLKGYLEGGPDSFDEGSLMSFPGPLKDAYRAMLDWRLGGSPVAEAGAARGASATELRQLKAQLEATGKKLVHGVEFLMPEDLTHSELFGDITTRHLNAATLGNFFKGKTPVEARWLNDQRRRLALAEELGASPDSDEVSNTLMALQDFLRNKQKSADTAMGEYRLQPRGQRLLRRVMSSHIPLQLDDLAPYKAEVIDYLKGLGMDEASATNAWRATNRFRNSDFKDVGLYTLEAKMRSTNVAEWGLKTLTGSKYGDTLAGRLHGTVGAAGLGATVGAAQTLDDPNATFEDKLKAAAQGALIGGAIKVAGAVAGGSTAGLEARLHNSQYGYLANGYAHLRDSLRFSLSPWFDLSRYTEGEMLALTASPRRIGERRLALPLNASPAALRRRLVKGYEDAEVLATARKRIGTELGLSTEGMSLKDIARREWESYLGQFQKGARNDFDPDVMAEAGSWFQQRGILGFSPTDWMGAAYGNMRMAKVPHDEAYQAAREMYTYATKGRSTRSGAEMSANFLFFPFSFQKKALGHIAGFMNDDLSRSIIVHDALKTYQQLDERYDLDQMWKDHVPLLQKLNQLNLFAYGISPGRFGGINAQLFEGLGKLGWNLFVPGNLDIKDVSAWNEAKDVFHGLTPALNDIDWMMKDMKSSQFGLSMWPGHYTAQAQVRRGYDEWNDYKQGLDDELANGGWGLDDIHDVNKPWLAPVAEQYDAKKAELAEKYPAWVQSQMESVANSVMSQQERSLRENRYTFDVQRGVTPKPDDANYVELQGMLDDAVANLKLYTRSSDPADLDPRTLRTIKDRAIQMIEDNPGFKAIYGKFFQYQLGPISIETEL